MHVARVPLQHAWVLSADDLPNPIWSAVTTAQGQATKTFRWPKLEPSIGVSMGKRTYWDAEQNPELRDEALDRTAFRISELSSRYAIRNVYRVAVAPDQTATLIEIQFEEGINLTGRVRAGAMRVRTSCVGYLSAGGLVDWTINTDEPFSVLKAPKNRPFVLELGNASITIFTPVAAQAADHDAGLIDLRPFQSTRVVRVRGVYPLDYPANEKGTFLSFIRSDGLVIYNMYCAGDTIDAPLQREYRQTISLAAQPKKVQWSTPVCFPRAHMPCSRATSRPRNTTVLSPQGSAPARASRRWLCSPSPCPPKGRATSTSACSRFSPSRMPIAQHLAAPRPSGTPSTATRRRGLMTA